MVNLRFRNSKILEDVNLKAVVLENQNFGKKFLSAESYSRTQ